MALELPLQSFDPAHFARPQALDSLSSNGTFTPPTACCDNFTMMSPPPSRPNAVPASSPSQVGQSQYFGARDAQVRAPCSPAQRQTAHADAHQQSSDNGNGREQYMRAQGTAVFIQGSNLVAEAAKRAEMSVLMRDLGDVEL